MSKTNRIAIVAIACVLLMALAYSAASAQQAWSVYNRIMTDVLRVRDGGAIIDAGGLTVTAGGLTVTAGDATITSGNLGVTSGSTTLGGNLGVTGNATFSSRLFATPATAISVTQNATITPAGIVQPLEGSFSTSSIAAGTTGRIIILVNLDPDVTTITLTDTGTLKLSGNTALGRYDTLTLLSDGTNWIEIGQTDN